MRCLIVIFLFGSFMSCTTAKNASKKENVSLFGGKGGKGGESLNGSKGENGKDGESKVISIKKTR